MFQKLSAIRDYLDWTKRQAVLSGVHRYEAYLGVTDKGIPGQVQGGCVLPGAQREQVRVQVDQE